MKLFTRTLLAAILFSLIILGSIYSLILYHANNSQPEKSDVMIVLGCQIWGRYPSWMLEYRLQRTLELYKGNYGSYIIVSGGQGRDEATAESSVMKAWLVNHGIDKDKIIEESNSTSTYENLKFSRSIMTKRNFKTAIIVSNDFHIYRSLSIAKRLGIQASGAPAPTVPHLKLYYQLREILSVIKSFVLDR